MMQYIFGVQYKSSLSFFLWLVAAASTSLHRCCWQECFCPQKQHTLQKKVARLPLSYTTLVCKVSPPSCDQHNHGKHPSILQSRRSSSAENLSSEVQVVLLATVQWKGIRNIFAGDRRACNGGWSELPDSEQQRWLGLGASGPAFWKELLFLSLQSAAERKN